LPKIEDAPDKREELFRNIPGIDCLCHIVRAFKDDSIYHIKGSVDPKRDIDEINSELILNDLLLIEKRFERIEKDKKRGLSPEATSKEKEILTKLKSYLDKEIPLRLVTIKGEALNEEERKFIASYSFTTLKEILVVLNVSEDDLKDNSSLERFIKEYAEQKIYFTQISAKVEKEIAKLDNEEDRKEFLQSIGVSELSSDKLKQLFLKALNLVSFFTVVSDDLRQWLIKAGSTAPQAAGLIHSDLERGFIRTEVIKYQDLISFGNEHKVKEHGKLHIKGRDYIIEDGDILKIRFNV
jgi:hypothetical protein